MLLSNSGVPVVCLFDQRLHRRTGVGMLRRSGHGCCRTPGLKILEDDGFESA